MTKTIIVHLFYWIDFLPNKSTKVETKKLPKLASWESNFFSDLSKKINNSIYFQKILSFTINLLDGLIKQSKSCPGSFQTE